MFSFWIIDVKRSPKVEKRVKERIAKKLCLMVLVDGSECQNPIFSGGQCKRCANAFQYELLKLPSEKVRNKFRARMISLGYRLRPQEQRTMRRASVSAAAKVASTCVEVA